MKPREGLRPARLGALGLLIRTTLRGGGWVGLLVGTSLVSAAGQVALPAVFGRAVDAVVGRAPFAWVTWTAVLVGVLTACDALDDLAAGATTARSTRSLRRSMVSHLFSLDAGTASRFGSGDFASRLAGNAGDAGRAGSDLVHAATNAAMGLGGAVALALIDPWICLTFLAGLPLLVLLARAFGREASITAERYLDAQGRIASRLVEAVSGARTIAAAGTMDREVARVLAPLPELRRHGDDMWRQQARFGALDALLIPMLVTLVIAVAGAELARGRITPGELLAAGQYAMLGTGLTSAVMAVRQLARARAGAARAGELFGLVPVAHGDSPLPAGRGRLEFRDVAVRAGDRLVLDAVNFSVPAGALYAIVGPSGSGKSVLAGLAARLRDPTQGEVLLDGVSLSHLTSDALRNAVTYAFERPALIGDTLAGAIAFGRRSASSSEVTSAALAAQADSFIRRFPQSYETPLSQAPMSGGETQRVGLARAFAHAGRVIVLDDVAASLDTVTEHEISLVLTGQLSDRTRLVVAHRASTAARSDVVIWLEAGRVRATAPHAELWRQAEYRRLFGPEDAALPNLAAPRPAPPGRGFG